MVKGDLGTGNILRKTSRSHDKEEMWTSIQMEEATEVRGGSSSPAIRSSAYQAPTAIRRQLSLRVRPFSHPTPPRRLP